MRNKTKGIELTYFDLAPKRVSKILLIADSVLSDDSEVE